MTDAQKDQSAEAFINDAVTWFATRYQLRPEHVADQFRNVLDGNGKLKGSVRRGQAKRSGTAG